MGFGKQIVMRLDRGDRISLTLEESMSIYAKLTCALTLSALALSAQAIPVLPAVQTTGMVGIAFAQTAQLNLLNPGVEAPATGAICIASVSFVDSAGTILKTATVTVAPGTSSPFVLHSDVDLQLVSGNRREIRATISIPAVPPPTATAAPAPAATAAPVVIPACRLIPTLEIIDTPSGRTLVVLGHVETVPSDVTTNSN
jgi:hypothetical protein